MLTFFKVGLDDEAVTLLLNLSAVVGKPPRKLIAELLRAILIEDADAHGERSGRPVHVDGITYH